MAEIQHVFFARHPNTGWRGVYLHVFRVQSLQTGGVWMSRVLQDISTIWFAKTCGQNNSWVVVSNAFFISNPIWGRFPFWHILTNNFQMGWKHQLDSKPSSLMQSQPNLGADALWTAFGTRHLQQCHEDKVPGERQNWWFGWFVGSDF